MAIINQTKNTYKTSMKKKLNFKRIPKPSFVFLTLLIAILLGLPITSCQSAKTNNNAPIAPPEDAITPNPKLDPKASTSSANSSTTETEESPAEAVAKQEASPSPKKYSWSNQMQKLTQHLLELLPALTDPKAPSDTKRKELFESQITALKQIAHNMNENTVLPDQDPSLKLIGKHFEDNLKLTLDSFETGHTEFARSSFKIALAQCVQCHTRTNVGPALAQPHFITSLKKVAVVERVQFLVASRYFDDAMKEISATLKNEKDLPVVTWEKLVQMGLIINVRYRNDARESQQFLKLLAQNKKTPTVIMRQLPFWQQSVKEWNRKTQPPVDLATAKQMVQRGHSSQKKSRGEGGTIEYLRAARLLHQFLTHNQAPAVKAEALMQLGSIYENVGEIGAWSMNEDYYELCIRTSPHSEIAKKCFEKFKESTISGYSGTSGVNIPEDVQKRMTELQTIAL